MSRSKINQWVWECPKCQRKVWAYVQLTEAICSNHSLGKPVYMVLTSQPKEFTSQQPAD